ncbi:ABC transporter ATP-binding protein [Collinsella tanakaei]|uniref:ABC transporter ATP-binding protein n=1 Tax=Collinsella tanakaei TaxID=626935 RepID=UPI0019597639|nr:ABC transporter ATP-binding protein [Collinsella tanakaei]
MSPMASDSTIPAAPLIDARSLTKHYDGFSLQDVNLTVDEGEVVGFVGQNGAGKSTTIKALLGIIELDGGEARVLGTDAHDLGHTSAGARTKEEIGVVFDTVSVPGHLRVADVGHVHALAYSTWSQHIFNRLTRAFALDPAKQVKDLSRGMGMKLSLACALSHGARLLILDEATAGLDPMARDEVLDLLRGFVEAPGHAVLMSSHITSDLEKIADRVVCIEDGRIVFNLAKDEITDEMGIARCRACDFETICASGIIPEREIRYRKHDYGIDLLVPDRFAFAENFPNIPVDHMTIDDYLTLTLKGGVR